MFARIRRRLTMGYVGILALILVLFGAIVLVFFYRQVNAEQDLRLNQKAEAEADELRNLPAREGRRDREYKRARIRGTVESDIAVIAVSPDGLADADLLGLAHSSTSLGLPYIDLAQQADRDGRTVLKTVEGPEGATRVMSTPVFDDRTGEIVAIVQAAQLRQAVWETVNGLIFVLVPVGLGALVLATIGGLYTSRRAMRPVRDSFDRQKTFIADASHELKTPLTLIRADAEVLYRGLVGPDDRELVEDLLGETDRMNAVLSDLLLLARLDAEKLSVHRETFTLSAVLAETAERFSARAAAEGKRLEVDCSGKLPARGDAERAGQILVALLDNALRLTPEGGLITVTGRVTGRDKRVEATVTDTGPGIPEEHLPHVFERFYRADAGSAARTRSPQGGGTGLGLAIARDLARAQGGELTASNTKGGGASFTLRLPAGS